jgi:3-hydroxyacyl-[acyl-carrier-protein] dehydratase
MEQTEPSADNPRSADIQRIQQLIPHRYPFLMIDEVREMRGDSAVGIKNVTINEPQFQGHFPTEPVMPGVLIVEAMAQTSAVLIVDGLDLPADVQPLVYFMTLDKTRFRSRVTPGDRLELHVQIMRSRARVWKFRGEGKVDGKVVAEAEYSAMIVLPEGVEPGSGSSDAGA